MSLEALASNQHHTVTQLSMEALVVELLENMLEVTWKVHYKKYCSLSNTAGVTC